ncbi:MAG: hypothetical protein HOC84_01165 [Flavobacteriaceae bacterium]|nr:hypothetical protein [Flavobacteriaceae bacterium]
MFEILDYLGKFHPVIIHLPIGALYLTFCLVLLEKFFKNSYTIPIRFGLLFSFVFALFSCLLGYFHSLGGDYSAAVLDKHMWLGISTALFNGVLLWLHKQSNYEKYFIPLFAFTIVLLSITGHFGGSITHGKDYLKIPEFNEEVKIVKLDSINLYTQVIHPILDSKCVKCHNQNKLKGGLILDSKNSILKGGESGEILTAFKPASSNLYNYPNLPIEDEMHMPPEGNSQLTNQEIQLIKLWIESGSDFENVTLIENLSSENKNTLISFLPQKKKNVSPPSLNHLKKLMELDFRLERNSNENNFVEAKFLGKELSSKHLMALLKIKEQLIKLDLSNTNLNDKLIYKIKSLKNLKYLKINNTKITDKALSSISASVESLNLNENNVTSKGVVSLFQDGNIKNIYLWNTNISNEKQKELINSYTAKFNFGVSDFAKGVPLSAPKPISGQTMFSDSLQIEFYKPLGNPTIRYTLNGEDPDSLSAVYTKPFSISSSLTLKSKAFKEGWLDSKIGSIDFMKVEGILKDYVLKTNPDNRYRKPKKLFDGIVGDVNFRDGHWNGFIRTKDYVKGVNERNSGDLVLEIDLKDKSYSTIGIHALESLGAYIMFPKSVELYDISQKKEKLIYSKNFTASNLGAPNLTKFYKVPITNKSSKLKLVVKSNKQLPKGHPAEGEYAWLFVDEIMFL